MARVTVEDCIKKVSNRFELIVDAAQRTRQLGAGALPTVDRDNDRNTVVSLREIAANLDIEKLRAANLATYRRHLDVGTSEEITEHLAEETKHIVDPYTELSLTGEPDEIEADLEKEFSEIEKSIESHDHS